MTLEIEIPDEVAKRIGDEMRKPKPGKSDFDNVCRSIITDKQAARAHAEVLLNFWYQDKVKIL